MRFSFRVDSSATIGAGHVMRCLTLANFLRSEGDTCIFHCHPQTGDLIEAICKEGFVVEKLGFDEDISSDKPIDWLIVDHYGLDSAWESRQRRHASRLLIIDDLANRPHDADILLDQNLRNDAEARYRPLVPPSCQLLLGPSHVLLRPTFDDDQSGHRDGRIRNVLIHFGGADLDNQTGRAMTAATRFPGLNIHVVLGTSHPHREALHRMAQQLPNVRIDDVCSDMSTAMRKADLALGACGIAAWERCALGLPTLTCVIAYNQREDAVALAQLGAAENLGESCDVTVEDWELALRRIVGEPERLLAMGMAARAVVVGHTENRAALIRILHTNGY